MARARGESESETRRTRIDPKLIEQGWEVVPFDPNRPVIAYTNHAVTEFPTADGTADYGLFVAGRPLGLVEAKRLTLGPQNVLTQAERYAKGVPNSPFNYRGFRVPFLYPTNGEVIWFHDVRDPLNRSRRLATFRTPAALQEVLGRDFNAACDWFGENANDHPRLRPYQIEANTAIERAIAERVRLMATGTGKTFTLVNEVYRLMESGVGKWILFLVDRRALVAQAVRAFASFEPKPSQKSDNIYEVHSSGSNAATWTRMSGSTPRCCPTPTSPIRSRDTPSSTSGAAVHACRGETSVRLDIADRLAEYFGVELVGKREGRR
jgi:type I restriction enzyme R subunit